MLCVCVCVCVFAVYLKFSEIRGYLIGALIARRGSYSLGILLGKPPFWNKGNQTLALHAANATPFLV